MKNKGDLKRGPALYLFQFSDTTVKCNTAIIKWHYLKGLRFQCATFIKGLSKCWYVCQVNAAPYGTCQELEGSGRQGGVIKQTEEVDFRESLPEGLTLCKLSGVPSSTTIAIILHFEWRSGNGGLICIGVMPRPFWAALTDYPVILIHFLLLTFAFFSFIVPISFFNAWSHLLALVTFCLSSETISKLS